MEFIKRYCAHVVVILIVSAVGVMLYVNKQTATRPYFPVPDHEAKIAVTERVKGVVLAPVGESGVPASVAMVQRGGRTTVEFTLGVADETRPLNAEVLTGSCDEPGEFLYPLTPLTKGVSVTELVMRIEDMALGHDDVIVVLRDGTDDTISACADLGQTLK